MRDPNTMAQIAEACVAGGAAAIRCQGIDDIRAIKERVDVPVIGLVKEGSDGVFITPTFDLALKTAAAGADIVALDATDRPRPDGLTFQKTVHELGKRDIITLGDCSSLNDIGRSFDAGCLFAATTLSRGGAAIEHGASVGPDLRLIQDAAQRYPHKPLICEGCVHTPQDAQAALKAGAFAVVVGTAITHPATITSWYRDAMYSL